MRCCASSSSSARLLAPQLETVYLGGGTPTFTERATRSSGCSRRCPRADELTVEANPETVTPELAALLVARGVDRVSLGAQSFAAAAPRRARSRCPA